MFDDLLKQLATTDTPTPVAPPKAEVQVPTESDIVVTGKRLPAPVAPAATTPAVSSGSAAPEMNMFTDAPAALNQGIAGVKGDSSNLNDVFANVAAGLKSVSDQKMATLTTAVAAKKQLNDSITATNNEILGEVAPLFATRQALADRRAALSNMNPIKKAIFGIFDRNYSEHSIESREAAVTDQIQSRGEEFSQMNQLTGQLLNAVSGNAEGAVSLLDLKGENLNQDLQLAGTKLQYSRAGLDDTLKAIGAKGELTRTQVMLTDKVISEMDGTSLNAAISAAQKNGGKAMVNGAEVSTAQLQERSQQLQRQQLALVAAKQEVTSGSLRIKSQQMQLSQQAEGMLVDHMSFSDTQKAMNAGGVFHGRQLNMADLGTRMARLNAGVDATVEANSGGNNVRITGQLAQELGHRGAQMAMRASQLFGRNPPPAIVNMMHNITQTLNDAGKTIHGATGPTAAKTISALAPGIQGQLVALDKLMDRQAQAMTRDPDAQIAIGSFLKGNPMTAEQAVKSVIAFSTGGGLPPGVKLGGPVAAAMAAGNKAMQQVGTSDDYKRADAAGKQRLIQQAVASSVGRVWTGQQVARINAQLPDLASQMGDEFGKRINRDQFAAAQQAGDAQGLQHVTDEFNQKYGTKFQGNDIKMLFNGDKGTIATVKKASAEFDPSQIGALKNTMTAYQTSAWMQNLDQIGGSGTSKAFAAFLRRDDVQTRIGGFADSLGRAGFGEALADSMAPGGVRGNFANAAQLIGNQVTMNDAANLQSTRARIAQYSNDPVARAGTILANVEGISQHDRAIAEGVIRQAAAQATAGEDAGRGATGFYQPYGNATSSAANEAIETAVKGTRYKDPGLNRIMSHVAQNWEAAAGATDRVMGRLAAGKH